jgi:hypothetical protein
MDREIRELDRQEKQLTAELKQRAKVTNNTNDLTQKTLAKQLVNAASGSNTGSYSRASYSRAAVATLRASSAANVLPPRTNEMPDESLFVSSCLNCKRQRSLNLPHIGIGCRIPSCTIHTPETSCASSRTALVYNRQKHALCQIWTYTLLNTSVQPTNV